MHRTIDANINRVCEGLRVIEDILRFELNLNEFIGSLKKMRHFLREDFSNKFKKLYIGKRDSINDAGKEYSETETKRDSITDLLKANFYRAEEGLRVLEESVKVTEELKGYSPVIKAYRFEVYEIEKKVLERLAE